MSEKHTKAEWQEKKKHGSNKERQAAVSVQVGRVAAKLLQRAGNLEYPWGREANSDKRFSVEKHHSWHGLEHKSVISTGKRTYKPMFGKERMLRATTISRHDRKPYGPGYYDINLDLVLDPEGDMRPLAVSRSRSPNGITKEYRYVPSPEEVTRLAADDLYTAKKAIDNNELRKNRRAA